MKKRVVFSFKVLLTCADNISGINPSVRNFSQLRMEGRLPELV